MKQTSAVANQKTQKKSDEVLYQKFSIPLYGPLNIGNAKAFNKEQRKIFQKCFSLPCPKISLQNFEIMCKIGEGGFGKVYLVVYKSQELLYAMKMIKKKTLVEKNSILTGLTEKRILQSLNFPFCVSLQFLSQDKGHLYYFLPYICGGEMFTLLKSMKRFDENLAKFYAAQILLGLEFLHYCNLVYRDLKPENVLIDHTGYIKITDFGFSKEVKTRLYTFCGTPEYIAPEIILGLGHGKAVDYWSLGILLYEMVNGKTPFRSSNNDNMETFMRIVAGHYDTPTFFSTEIKDLINKLLQGDVTRRHGNLQNGPEDIKRHKWFKKTNWLALLSRKITPPYKPMKLEDVKAHFPAAKCVSDDLSSIESVNSEQDYDKYFEDF